MKARPRIAIIGAGLAGVTLARRLVDHAEVCLFEKSKGLGGRMSTRRSASYQFDHGAQYFTARGEAFRNALQPYLQDGTVQKWTPRLVALPEGAAPLWTAPRYVAVPGMTALCKAMAQGLAVHRATRIADIEAAARRWRLRDETGGDCGLFDWVICTAPAEQSARLMPQHFAHAQQLGALSMRGCYSLMIGMQQAPDPGWDAAFVGQGPLSWMAMNHSKPGRSAAFSLLCQTRNDWAEAHLEEDQKEVQRTLVEAAAGLTGLDLAQADHISLHRWRFAKVARAAEAPFLLDAEARLAVAGDWCGAGRVEAAFDSGSALADKLLQRLEIL